MIYTIGLREKYEPRIDAGTAMKAGPHADKQGRHQNGGWVWRSAAEARTFLKLRNGEAEREVYAVMAEWELDAVTIPGEPTRCLTRDALVFRLSPGEG